MDKTHAPSRTRPFLYLGLVLVLLMGGYGLYWRTLASGFEQRLFAWAETQKQHGVAWAWDSVSVGGFPFGLEAEISNPRAQAPAAFLPWEWRTDRLLLNISILGANDATITTDTPQMIQVGFGNSPQAIQAAGHFEAQVSLMEIKPVRLVGNGLTLEGLDPASSLRLDAATLTLAQRPADMTDPKAADWTGEIALYGFDLPADAAALFGPRMKSVELRLSLYGLPPRKPPAQALTEWNQNGGTLEAENLSLDWGPLRLAGNATIALDNALQPLVAGAVHVRGLAATVEHLTEKGWIGANEAALLKTFLAAQAKANPNAPEPTLPLPLTVQDGAFFVGPVRVLTLPSIEWPGAQPQENEKS